MSSRIRNIIMPSLRFDDYRDVSIMVEGHAHAHSSPHFYHSPGRQEADGDALPCRTRACRDDTAIRRTLLPPARRLPKYRASAIAHTPRWPDGRRVPPRGLARHHASYIEAASAMRSKLSASRRQNGRHQLIRPAWRHGRKWRLARHQLKTFGECRD